MGRSIQPRPFLEHVRGLLRAAIEHRSDLVRSCESECYRLFWGPVDGAPGVVIDRYGPAAVLILLEGSTQPEWIQRKTFELILEELAPIGIRSVYHKIFPRERRTAASEGGARGETKPAAGLPQPEALIVDEHGLRLEIRLFDGLSTGLFLDQRLNRRFVASVAQGRRTLNMFAYTCAFSVAAARGSAAEVTSVDVSKRYLDWGIRNFAHSSLGGFPHRTVRMDAFEYLAYATRKSHKFDLIILDPPTFASANRKLGTSAWRAEKDYPRLVSESLNCVAAGGILFASTNSRELCVANRFARMIREVVPRDSQEVEVPGAPPDCGGDRAELACVAFRLGS